MLKHAPEPASAATRLRPSLFAAVRNFAYRAAGIDLQEGKQLMVAARLWKRARAHGFPTADDYFAAVQRDPGGALEIDLIDALTTNFTSFFREPAHFEFLRARILPQLRLRSSFPIWTAASSTGEEPYSIAVTLLEELGADAGRRARVLASDISTKVLDRASAGIYPEERFRSLPPDWRRRYLLRGTGEQAGNYRFRPEVRNLIQFQRINLMESLPLEDRFPLIFLRNIMIYFDRPTQARVIAALTEKLEPGGYLFLGHSESLNGISHQLDHIQVAIYRKPGEWGA
ncbi:CheR family methyltransferase [Bryobacter aggregatus]|uniref:CheR family methyltransferase n=1 Tax=Bryobacter aggregatus TaxID=360054 RepID=UPI00068D7DE6|nr:protein-glutamate O-methyltransferase CheR [Bryobacter aggregatus]